MVFRGRHYIMWQTVFGCGARLESFLSGIPVLLPPEIKYFNGSSKQEFFREETVMFLVFEIVAFSWLQYIPYFQTEHYWALVWHILAKSAQCHTVPVEQYYITVYVTQSAIQSPIQSEACKTKAFPSTNCGGTVSVVTSCRSCQGSILGHMLCSSWGGSPSNEAAEGADVCYMWCRQTRDESYTHLWYAQLKQCSVTWHSKIGCFQP